MKTRFAAIVAHADDPDLLARCIAHHLAGGVERVFVSLNVDDPESERVARSFEHTGRVRAARLESFARDPFHHFTEAKRPLVAWCDPEWLMFVDSDEFWISRTGRIGDAAGLDDADLLDVPMLQSPPVREPDGTIRAWSLADPANLPVVGSPVVLNAGTLGANPELAPFMSWGTKVLVRTAFAGEVGRGAHDVTSYAGAPRRRTADDLAIVHVPFTTRARFRRKVDRVRSRLHAYGDRFTEDQAWHWRRWLEIDEAGGLNAEFDRNALDARRLPELTAQGIVTTAADRLARERAACER